VEEDDSAEIIVPDEALAPYYGVECPCGHITFAGAVPVGPREPVFHALTKRIGCEQCGTIVTVQSRNVYWRDSDPNHPIRTSPFYRRHSWRVALLHGMMLKSWKVLLHALVVVLYVIERALRMRRRSHHRFR
jgi:hypothetical protein